jgi:hypothetical protein
MLLQNMICAFYRTNFHQHTVSFVCDVCTSPLVPACVRLQAACSLSSRRC